MKFEASDFLGNNSEFVSEHYAQFAADRANTLLQAWLSEQPVVYDSRCEIDSGGVWFVGPHYTSTHTARLVAIEEIK